MVTIKRPRSTKAAYNLLHRGTLMLSEIMFNGVRVDIGYIDKTVKKMIAKAERLEAKMMKTKIFKVWQRTFGERTNIRSHDQLAKILFGKLGYKSTRKTKGVLERYDKLMAEGREAEAKHVMETGRDATNKDALEDIDTPFVRRFMKVNQIRTTIVKKGLQNIKREAVKKKGGWFVHPQYHFLPATYRSGCENPNYQNNPVRDPWIAEVTRKTYIPRYGRRLIENDLSQIEVRIAAVLSKDKKLMKYILDKKSDMHTDTAAEMFMLEPGQVAKNPRYAAKNMMVFPQFYGSVYFQCAPHVWKAMHRLSGMVIVEKGGDKKNPQGMSLLKHLRKCGIKELGDCTPGAVTRKGTLVHHLKGIEDRLWNERFTGYRDWKRQFYTDYLSTGGFRTATGFYIFGELSRNDVTNYPVQGPAFHCELWIMLELSREIRKRRMESLLIGQIHDCCVGDVPDGETQEYLDLVKDIAEVRLPKSDIFKWITVPIEVEAEVTEVNRPWSEKKDWHKKEGLWQLKV